MRLHEWLAQAFARLFARPPVPDVAMGALRTSIAGRKTLMDREGVMLNAYRDTKGIWTIGVGHTTASGPPSVTPGLRISTVECADIFTRDLIKFENAVKGAVHVPLNQGEFDALVSFCFNIGPGAFLTSTVVRKLNEGDKVGAASAIMNWKIPKEIIQRRAGEYRQFAQAAGIPAKQWIA
jgi:lysozyme